MTNQQIVYLSAGLVLVLLGVILSIVKVVLNLKANRSQVVSLKESQVGGLAGIWSFTKRHFLMFSIIVCFAFGFVCFMGLVF